MAFDISRIKNFPRATGVYIMRDRKGAVLYVGKAKNLRDRVRQYFIASGDTRAMIPYLVAKVADVETIVVASEKEALLLENNLIKKYKPRYNALLKDDKTYIALKVATRHEWPTVSLVRYRGKPKPDGLYFGPYTSAYAARETLDLIQKVFPLRQCSDQELKRRTRPCILYDMKRCIAPCVGKCSREEYDLQVNRLLQFLRGHSKEVLKHLEKEMQKYSDELQFEKAADVLKKIKSIEKTLESQLVDKPVGVDTDALGLYRQGSEVLLVKLIIRSGKMTGMKQFSFSEIAQDNTELLTTFLLQHYGTEPQLPHEILLPEKVENTRELSEILSAGRKTKTLVFSPMKGRKKSLTDMAENNAKSAFFQERSQESVIERNLLEMKEKLRLNHYPKRIECIDNSSLSASEPVSAVVVYTEGKQDKKNYRKYKIKAAKPGDDYGAMYEVLMRRYSKLKEENDLPDLLIIDGGRGQLNVALRVFKDLNIISVDVIALVKEKGRHDKGQTAEKIYLPHLKDPITPSRSSSMLFLLQQIRDEAHRFAITFQRKRRSKERLSSILEKIPGVGEVKRKALLKHLGSLQRVKEAAVDELEGVPGISKKDAAVIKDFFSHKEE
jgi:excinuclease ABC subunit C